MGLWDWLGRVLGGHQKARRPAPPPAGSSGRPQPSPPPGDKLGAISNQQITSWDPGGVSYGTATTRVTPNQQQGGPSISPPALPPVPARRDGSRAAPPPPPRPKPPAGLEALDASQFAPMTSDDVRAFIKDMGSAAWRNAFLNGGWGRGMIPAPSITRIQLIDRAMVGLGFITPEELVQIHEVGLQMDKARGDLRLAAEAANRAVIQSEEERKALKERKKAEAAERRRLHAEQVAHRRATDIVFLGRGVSGGLADRRSNVEKLQAAVLPVLSSPADLAAAMQIAIGRLRWLAFHSDAAGVSHYVRFRIPKKSGGYRELAAPHREMAAAQRWILDNVLNKLPVHDAAQGFVRQRSTVTNASAHVGRQVVVNCDLKDFFPSIGFPRVRGIFKCMGYSPAVATVLALLCTDSPRQLVEYEGKKYHVAAGPRGLPQGACTSPVISNLIARTLDARLVGLCGKQGWTYTRYADDLTFSASGEPSHKVGFFLARVRHLVADEGFAVNEAKTRVLRSGSAQLVTGIVVNQHPNLPRRQLRRLRAILHHAKSEGLEAQNRQSHPFFQGYVRGMIAYVSMVNPQRGAQLKQAFESLP